MSTHRHRQTTVLLSSSWLVLWLMLLLSPLNTSAANLTGLNLTPPNPTLNINETLQLIATGIFDDGTQQVMAQAKQVSTGLNHSCAVSADGSIKCWGNNNEGQLGNGTTTNSIVPVAVSGINTAVVVRVGDTHSCALLADGSIKCWGYNLLGQLGNDTSISSPTPVSVSAIDNAVDVSVGARHGCALLADNTVKCWGDNSNAQLGGYPFLSNYSLTPIAVSDLGNAVAISAGVSHACVLISGGTIKCWGGNNYQNYGYGTTPITISGISTAVALSAAGAASQLTCAVLADSSMRCWGLVPNGQLDNVSGIGSVVAVGLGASHACASLIDGTLKCWAYSNFSSNSGQLGNGTIIGSTTPATVSGISAVVSVGAGGAHSCVVLADGSLRCWGSNANGQLGNGARPPYTAFLSPVVVSGLDSAKAVNAGLAHSCTPIADGTIKCWGSNYYGQLGNGTTTDSLVPSAVSGITTAAVVGLGEAHSCTLLASGKIRCWGANTLGQLGNGTTTNSSTSVAVSTIATAAAVSVGANHACSLLAGGKIMCWGNNNYGQLGNGTTTNSSTPVAVSGITNAVAVSAGLVHSCAALADGRVQCWGSGTSGSLGNGTTTHSSVPVTVSGLSTAVAVGSGSNFNCALLAEGTIKCWGDGGTGQLGNGTYIGSLTPVTVAGINSAVAVSAGGYHACAQLADRTVKCWGYNNFGQLGNGTTTYSVLPVTVSNISTATAISAGGFHVCVTLTDGAARCWGNNSHGQLGNGAQFSYYVAPTTTLGYHPLTWTSSNPSIVSVNTTGKLKALALGTSQISANLSGINASTTVTVPTATPPPVIDGFWPGSVPAGQLVLVFGQGFVPLQSQVKVNGISAPFVQVVDPTFLFFMLPPGDTQGPITVTTASGTATSSINFGTPLTGVTITGIWPSVTSPGQIVIVFGSGFVPYGTTVKLNGVDAPIRQVLYPDLMFFMVPPTATTGYVTVTTAAGSATSSGLLTIK